MLADTPSFSFSTLADGSYAAAWERYTAERLSARRLMRGVHARVELLLGKCQAGDVIACPNGELSRRLSTNAHIYQKNLKGITALKSAATQMSVPFTVAVAPRRIEARGEALPTLFYQEQGAANALTQSLPGAALLTVSGEEEWYRTDHHWSTKGAFAAYVQICAKLGITPYNETDFTKQTVSERFWGTTDAAAGLLDVAPDKIELWRYQGDGALTLTKDGKSPPFGGLYDPEKLQTRDGYAVFLGGNCGIVKINQSKNDTRPTLVIFKDSFANSVIPFLARHYQIIAIDPRYTTTDLTPFFEQADRALLLMGLQTLTSVDIL